MHIDSLDEFSKDNGLNPEQLLRLINIIERVKLSKDRCGFIGLFRSVQFFFFFFFEVVCERFWFTCRLFEGGNILTRLVKCLIPSGGVETTTALRVASLLNEKKVPWRVKVFSLTLWPSCPERLF